MKLDGLVELAKAGKMILHKYNCGTHKRARYYYSNEPDICDQKLLTVKYFPYKRYFYMARTPEMPQHQNYKITAKDWKILLEAGAKLEE